MAPTPTPALVTRRGAQRLPRWPLLLLLLAYLLPGLFGRDPWRHAELVAYGAMSGIAHGRADWTAPAIGGVALPGTVLPWWIGATAIRLLGPLLGDALAARLPFVLMLAGVMGLAWWACYYLARTEAAQPVPLAFGGEADPVDYARAVADGALLALVATLGLLQLGHETTPEMLQLLAATLWLTGMAAAPFHARRSHWAVALALPMLAASGGPVLALALAAWGLVLSRRSSYPAVRALVPWLLSGGVVAGVLASALGLWSWRWGGLASWTLAPRLLLWFTWPAGPLAAFTAWRWRSHWQRRHIAVPAALALTALAASLFMGGNDRALLIGLPALAILAGFALPTLQRSAAAAIEWFSLFFFSAWALFVWVMAIAVHTGVPAKPAANVARLLPGFTMPGWHPLPVLAALAGTLGWAALAVWRGGRRRHPLWTSMVLPASGVALGWLLVTTLMLAPIDYARSNRAWLRAVDHHVPPGACVELQGPLSLAAALETLGRREVHADGRPSACQWRLTTLALEHADPAVPTPGWQFAARVRRPGDSDDTLLIWRRSPPP